MATSVVKLTIDSKEYDAKLKSAGKALNEYFDIAKKGDRTFELLDEGVLEAVQAIGQMETRSKSASGQLKELENAFRDMSIIYKRFTDEEKSAPVGKAMAQSLAELKSRINDTKGDLSDINKEIGGGGGLTVGLEQLSGKFGISIQQLGVWGSAIGAAKVALDVAKDAFFQSESNIDEWGRSVQGAQGAYSVFLDTINGGNWSNFLSNISTAVQGARDLYDALDRLGSIKSNNRAAIAMTQQEIQQLRLAKQQGKDVDGQIAEATQKLAALQQQSVDAGKYAGNKMVGEIIRNTYNTQYGARPLTQDSIDKAASELLKDGQAAFDKYNSVYKRLSAKAEDTRTVTVGSSITGAVQTSTERYTNLAKLTDEERKQYLLSKAITEAETQIQSGISAYAQAVEEETSNSKEQFKNNRYALTGSGRGAASKELTPIQDVQKKISDLTNEALTADDERLEVIKQEVAALNEQLKVYQSIQAYVSGNEPRLNQPVGDRKAFEREQLAIFDANSVTNNRIFNEKSISTFISDLKKELQQAELGSDLYNSITKQLADANALANVMQVAIKNGIDIAQFNPQELWSKVFGDTPGDYIDDATWKEIEDKINAKLKELKIDPINLNVSTGTVQSQKEHKRTDDQYLKSFTEPMNSMTHDLSAISSSLKTLGLDVPEGVDKMLGGMQAITTILTAIQSLISISNATSGLSSIPIIGGIASLFVGLFSGFNKGGIVPHAANGYYVPGTHYSGDMTPIMANAGELVLNESSERNLAEAIKNAQSLVGSINDIYIADTTAIGSRQNGNLSNELSRASRGSDVNVSISSDNIKLTLRNGAQARGMTLGQYLEL